MMHSLAHVPPALYHHREEVLELLAALGGVVSGLVGLYMLIRILRGADIDDMQFGLTLVAAIQLARFTGGWSLIAIPAYPVMRMIERRRALAAIRRRRTPA
jgi:hypothetical protein